MAGDLSRIAEEPPRVELAAEGQQSGEGAAEEARERRQGRLEVAWRPRRIAVERVLGLYVHITFCSAICNYCNFNRGLFDAEQKTRYVSALLTEINRKGDGSPADTIFLGGGTPSLLEPSEVQSIIDACRRTLALTPDAEITLEANPETATLDRLRPFRAAGVIRLTFG